MIAYILRRFAIFCSLTKDFFICLKSFFGAFDIACETPLENNQGGNVA